MHRNEELFGNVLHITLNKSDPDAGGGLTGKYIVCGSIACGVYCTTMNTSQQFVVKVSTEDGSSDENATKLASFVRFARQTGLTSSIL